ncbi:hypothetical protein A2127_00400 [Candidatus Jorgensenbacteria bacterium GWC1_48_12]|uniref:Glutamate dehydrogenase n=3 Tax=Parcubacteria group TaxID=1794811 RepID=A0A1F6BS82_9BACT|nr:MAG: Glutamate dehydrogenase [Candidatus Azambacteria bacterium GW2011_GWB1_42_17]KKS45612.1 MAG: Glutamate dehydrogenase [Candidatus Azambacteria bacterium GW2011_GWA1_42_19]OGG39612.1 MAG: hypothetical protein A2127_00400 [Candidatus Jorgensenbacteria bacterium GWC1_48_12]
MENLNPKYNIQQLIINASKYVDIHSRRLMKLLEPERLLRVRMVVETDDGIPTPFLGYRGQYATWMGPAKGGIRFHCETDEDEVSFLCMAMGHKCNINRLPFGGGKGGVKPNFELIRMLYPEREKYIRDSFPKKISPKVREDISRKYEEKIRLIIGPDQDIPAPDVYTDGQVMAWIMDNYSRAKGYTVPAVITGKPVILGGSLGRDKATGRGTFITALEACKYLGVRDFEKERVAIQGFGNAGSVAAKLFHEAGFVVIAVSDSRGGVHNAKGLDPVLVEQHKIKTGSVVGFEGDQISNEELLSLPCTVLVPAALENSITENNASDICARIIAEAANGPTTAAADKILFQKDIFIVPDILANAGGVIVSYFEWVQGREQLYWTEKEVNERLSTIITESFRQVVERHDKYKKYKVDMRTAAYIYSLERFEEAGRLRGC